MTTAPEQFMIDRTLAVAAQSTCRSKRGVTLYDMRTGAFRGAGHNGPPQGCPGRAVCAGTCGKRSVHAEVRALWAAEVYRKDWDPFGPFDLIHVEIAADGGVVPCGGPSCPGCAAQILDVGFVAGVWLYEETVRRCLACERFEDSSARVEERYRSCPECRAELTPFIEWRRYAAAEFYEVTMRTVRP